MPGLRAFRAVLLVVRAPEVGQPKLLPADLTLLAAAARTSEL